MSVHLKGGELADDAAVATKRRGRPPGSGKAASKAKTKAKVSTDMPMFSEGISGLIGTVRGKFGAQSIITGSELSNVQARRIPLGVFDLDVRIGGGIPKGRITLIAGQESSCKTSLMLKMCGTAQKLCRFCHTRMRYTVKLVKRPNGKPSDPLIPVLKIKKSCTCGKNKPNVVLYMDIEGTLDYAYARRLGFNTDLALITQPDTSEQGIDVFEAAIRSGEIDVGILDSIAAMTPTSEVEESMEKWQMGLGARLTNKAMRKIGSAMNSLGAKSDMKPAIVLINQFREKLGVYHGDPTTLPNGAGQRFAASIRIDLTGSKVIRVDDKGKELEAKGEPVGRLIRWSVKKNKVSGGHGASGEFKYYNVTSDKFKLKTGDVNNDEQILSFAMQLGLVDVVSGGNYSYGEVKAKGKPGLLAALREAGMWSTLRQDTAAALASSAVPMSEDDE